MPTYDYVCDGCGHAFELFQSMTDSVKKTCPECGEEETPPADRCGSEPIVFEEPASTDTDYRSESYKKAAAADSGSKPAGDGGKKPEKKSD